MSIQKLPSVARFALCFLCFSAAAAAQQFCPEEPYLDHSSGAGQNVGGSLVSGEEWGVTFDAEIPASHYPIEISRISIGWSSILGGGSPTTQDSLRIYPAGLPNPGVAQYVLPFPVFSGGAATLFDLSAVPSGPGLDRVITQGPFTITCRVAQDSSVLFDGPAHDGNGCHPGKNVLFCIGGLCSGWTDACAVGTSGDWKIRVFYRRVDCANGGTVSSFCDGNGGTPTCANCPCGNDSALGSAGGCVNSDLRSCELSTSGNPSVTNDTLRFEVSGATSSTFGILIAGTTQLPSGTSCPEGGGVSGSLLDGLRCVGGGVLRLGTRMSDAAGHIGLTTSAWGPPNGPAGGISSLGGFVPGQVRHFQVFYREDSARGCMTGQNTSNAVSVLFTP